MRLSKPRLGAERRTEGPTGGQTALGREPRWQRRIGIHGVQGIAIIPVLISALAHTVIIAGECLAIEDSWGGMAVTVDRPLRINIPSQTGQQGQEKWKHRVALKQKVIMITK